MSTLPWAVFEDRSAQGERQTMNGASLCAPLVEQLSNSPNTIFTDFCSKHFSVNSLFHNEFYPFLLKAVLGKFLA